MTEIKSEPARLADEPAQPSRGRIAWYWVATAVVAITLAGSALEDLAGVKAVKDEVAAIGFPAYVLTILGIWKLLGTAALLAPRRPLLKEWAYAGTFFLFTGGLACNMIKNTHYNNIVLLFILIPVTIASWMLRPANRRIPRVEDRYEVDAGVEVG
jgi:hypothetical protein